MTQFQKLIEAIYLERDSARGVAGTTLWFVEEVGELVRAIRREERHNLEEEFADVYAWLATLASLHGIDLEAIAQRKYGIRLPPLPGHALCLSSRPVTADRRSRRGTARNRRAEDRFSKA